MKLIIEKYLEGRATDSEMKELLEWLRKKKNRIVFHKFKLDWKHSLGNDSIPAKSRDGWNRLQEQLAQKSFTRFNESRRLQFIFRIAAIFFFVVSLGLSAYFYASRTTKTPEIFTSVFAENGQISKVELPDGSLVWLNSGSEIKYSNRFATENRDIQLTGEAYFQAAKNSKLPMQVNCGEIQVKVLGTQFNVTAYPETGFIDVVLEEGAVQLLNPEAKDWSYSLKPGERAKFTISSRDMKVSNVNISKFTSWKDGIINIYNQPLAEVVERLELRYNQKFSVDSKIKEIRYTFTIKNEPLEEILQLMEKITPVKAVQEKDVITFKPDNTKMKNAGG
jgi:ferric-dicitrate binding protein FerR (iron transport regulator)